MVINHYSKKPKKVVWQLKKGDYVAVTHHPFPMKTIHQVDYLLNYKIGPHDVYTLVFSDGTRVENISEYTYFEIF